MPASLLLMIGNGCLIFGSYEKYPDLRPSPHYKPATEERPALLHCAISQQRLTDVSLMAIEKTGQPIREVANENPREAYAFLGSLFTSKFIDPQAEGWAIGSPEEDGELAYQGLSHYVEEQRAPDPDIEEIDVIISVWKRSNLWERLRGKPRFQAEKALEFTVSPQYLTW